MRIELGYVSSTKEILSNVDYYSNPKAKYPQKKRRLHEETFSFEDDVVMDDRHQGNPSRRFEGSVNS